MGAVSFLFHRARPTSLPKKCTSASDLCTQVARPSANELDLHHTSPHFSLQDLHEPLTYEFHYKTDNGLYSVVSYGSEYNVTTVLPPGKKEDDYELVFEIMVSDSLSSATNVELKIKVSTAACHRGVVALWLVRSMADRAVRVRALAGGHCTVFLGKTLYTHSASLCMGIGEFNAGGNPAMD